MKASRLSKLAMAAVAALMMAVQAKAQYGSNQATQGPAPAPAVAKRVIIVSLEDRKLALLEDGQVKRVYSVAVGKPSTPSPVGAFTIERPTPSIATMGRPSSRALAIPWARVGWD